MTAATAPSSSDRAPSVLAILVCRNASDRLRESLHALAAQTYPRLGILAIDDGSTDGSGDVLVQALGEGRVVRHDEPLGFARSFAQATALPVAAGVDFLLLLHDDAALDPEAVAGMVEATRLPGVERVGIVGAKIVDWERPRRLRDVGRSSDRFGHPYSPLQADEIDQGQFDRVLDVLAVDSCAMLVDREAWNVVGSFDERLGDDADLDLCWRARIAGWRVLMTPRARVRHGAVGERDDRPAGERTRRYEEDRAALAGTLKNYGLLSLLWIVPLGIVLTALRLLFLLLSRRFDEAYEVVAAVGWNLAHLPGTLARRRRAQKARRTRDPALRRFMESAGLRIPRWFQTAERILAEQRELDEEEEGQPAARRLRHRTASLVSTHPVIVASFLGAVVWFTASRHLFGPGPLVGGALPAFPSAPDGFFAELVSAYRTTGLGGSLAASPALGGMGLLSTLTFASTALAQKLMLGAGPVLAGILAYRAALRLSGRPGPSVVGAGAYVVSALMLWAFSDGRLALLVALAVTPPLVERLETAFARDEPADGTLRVTAGLAVTLAVGVAFEPGVALVFGVVVLAESVFGAARRRGLLIAAGACVGGAILVFPFAPALVSGGGLALGAPIGTQDAWRIVRLAIGDAPGSWPIAYFLPLAAVLGLALATGEHARRARRIAVVALVALALCWFGAAGYLPAALTNPPAFATLAASAEVFLIALGLASVAGGIEREAFGFRQIGTALITVVLTAGLLLQAVVAMTASWAVGGPGKIPPAWAVVDSAAKGDFRVLWIGAPDGRAFPPPAGDPETVVEAGDATLRYAVTGRTGVLAIDTARPLAGPGADALRVALGEILSGGTVHGGALLAPFGIRYVVGDADAIPPSAHDALTAQVDLNVVQATGMFIVRNAIGLPPAAALTTDGATRDILASSDPAETQRLEPIPNDPLEAVQGGWDGVATADRDTTYLSTEFDDAWSVEGVGTAPSRAFGWATSFPAGEGAIRVRYGAQLPRTIEIVLLGLLWVAALWITRKPVRR